MKSLLIRIFVILFAGIAFISCKSKSNIGSLIPSDALFVSYFNTQSLLEKLPYDSIKATQMFSDIITDSSISDLGKQILNDPSKSGIDLDKGLVLFVSKGDGQNYNLVFSGFVGKASDFETFNKGIDSGATIEQEKEIKTLVIKNKSVTGWNKDRFAYVLNVNNPERNFGGNKFENIKLPQKDKDEITSGKEFIVKLLNLSSKNSLSKESRFKDLMKDKGDVKVWINTEKIFQTASMGALGMLKLDALFTDSRTTYVINFENGKISAIQRSYYSKEMSSLIKKYAGDKIKPEDFSSIPSDDILAVFRVNFKPEGIKAFLKLAGLDGFVNMFANEMNISSDDLFNALGGKIMGSLSDLKIKPSNNKNSSATDITKLGPNPPRGVPPSGSKFTRPDIDFNGLLDVGVRNKAILQKLLDALQETLVGGDTPSDKLPFTLTDKELVISNNKDFANKFLEDRKGAKPEWADKISGHPFAFYMDIHKMLQSVSLPKDSATEKSLTLSLNFWKDVSATGGDFEGDALSIEGQLTLADQQRNSLRQLNSYFDALYKLNKNKIKEFEKKRIEQSSTNDNHRPIPGPDSTAPNGK